jgi:DNA modification methylase
MRIEKIAIEKINVAIYNPRVDLQPGDSDYENLKKSIDTFGLVEPLVWNKRSGNLVGGHQRLKVLIAAGFKEVEVSIVDLDPVQEKALNLALNKIQGAWDNEKLAELVEELTKIPDFDIGLTGFDLPEVSEILDRVEEAKEDGFDLEKELNREGEPVTQKGDLIILGRHRLLCGDSSNPADIKRLIGDAKVNLIFSDPPYNVNYYGGNRPSANTRPKKHRDWERIYNDNLSQGEYEEWLKTILKNVTPYLAPGAPCYLFNGSAQFGPMYQILTELEFHVSCVITWAKESFAIGYGDYNQQTEFCLYGWKEDNGAHHWYGPNNESTLWQVKRDHTASYNHPTQKPIALAHRAIKNSSKRGDIVLDMFLGSGTTLIAAEGLKRTCFALEIDPYYADSCIRRYLAVAAKDTVSEELRKKYEKEEINAVK